MTIMLLAKHVNTGGITSYLLTLTKGLSREGHKVIVCSSGGNCVDLFKSQGVEHISVFGLGVKSVLNPLMWTAVPHLKSIIKMNNVDIIHVNTRVTQTLAFLINRSTDTPFVSTCHGFFKPHFWRKRFQFWGNRVIAISSPVKKHLLNDFNILPESVVLIPNGIDIERFYPTEESRVKEVRDQWNLLHVPVIGIVARLSAVKGHEFLIKAMQLVHRKHPSAKCIIAGEGELEQKLKKQVHQLGLEDSVQFYKVVNNAQELLPLFDIFVLPSLNEGLGLSVMEAQASGLPVIVSNVGGLPDIVKDGETGILVSTGNITGLAKAISLLLDDEVYAKTLGNNARKFINEHFSSDKMVKETLKVYNEVLGS